MNNSLVIFMSMLAACSLICLSLAEQQGTAPGSISLQKQQPRYKEGVRHQSFGSEVPGFNKKRKLEDEEDRVSLQEDEEDSVSPSPSQEPVKSKRKHYAEYITGGVLGGFFLLSGVILVVYVCKTRKYIEERRQDSIARARSTLGLEDQFVTPVVTPNASPDTSVYFPPQKDAVIGKESFDSSLYIPAVWGLYPSSRRGSELEYVSHEWALYPQSTRGSSASIE